jgi:hypothetical protein
MAANDYTRSVSITPQSASYSWSTPPSWVTINRVGTSNDWTITIAPNSGIYRTTTIYVTHSNGVTTDSMNIIQEAVSSGGGAGPTATPVQPTATPVPPTATPNPTATANPLTFTLYSASGTSVSTGRSYTWDLSGYPQTGHKIHMGIYGKDQVYTITGTSGYDLSYDVIGAAYAAYLNGLTAANWIGGTSYTYTQNNPKGFEPTASYDSVNNRLTFNMNWVNTISPPYVTTS